MKGKQSNRNSLNINSTIDLEAFPNGVAEWVIP